LLYKTSRVSQVDVDLNATSNDSYALTKLRVSTPVCISDLAYSNLKKRDKSWVKY